MTAVDGILRAHPIGEIFRSHTAVLLPPQILAGVGYPAVLSADNAPHFEGSLVGGEGESRYSGSAHFATAGVDLRSYQCSCEDELSGSLDRDGCSVPASIIAMRFVETNVSR